ncbi:MAG: transglycosylase SLT domain-containing protein [Lysobacteraceae bacterium]
MKRLAALVLPGLFVAGCATTPPPSSTALPLPAPVPVEATPLPAPAEPPPAEPAAVPATPARIADGDALFERLRGRLQSPACDEGSRSGTWRRRYAGHATAFEAKLRRGLPLLAYVVEEVERRDLPGEFALIPIVESALRPEARGIGGPTGLWQMVAGTARHHGVRVGGGYDGRLSPVDSTRAALDYLVALQGEFDGWRATAMAYNAGDGRLRRALARSGDADVSAEHRRPAGLATVTYDYVAKLEALACLVAEPDRHGVRLPADAFAPLEARNVPSDVPGLPALARRWGVDEATLRRWNPSHRSARWTAATSRHVLLPSDQPRPMASSMSAAPRVPAEAPPPVDPSEEARHHRVVAGETLWRIARRYGVALEALRAANGLAEGDTLRVGVRLRIPD